MDKINIILENQGLFYRGNLELSYWLAKSNTVIPANKLGPDPWYAYVDMFTVTNKQDADTNIVSKWQVFKQRWGE